MKTWEEEIKNYHDTIDQNNKSEDPIGNFIERIVMPALGLLKEKFEKKEYNKFNIEGSRISLDKFYNIPNPILYVSISEFDRQIFQFVLSTEIESPVLKSYALVNDNFIMNSKDLANELEMSGEVFEIHKTKLSHPKIIDNYETITVEMFCDDFMQQFLSKRFLK